MGGNKCFLNIKDDRDRYYKVDRLSGWVIKSCEQHGKEGKGKGGEGREGQREEIHNTTEGPARIYECCCDL